MIILDTNVVSELMVASPSARVIAWLERQSSHDIHSTSITLAEIRYGTQLLPVGKRRQRLEDLSSTIFETYFFGKVLPFDEASALYFPAIAVSMLRKGMNVDIADLQIAAIAASRRATIATRNMKDFLPTRVDVVNPWTAD